MPRGPVLGKQKQEDRCRFKASLVYTVGSRLHPKTLSQNDKKSREQHNDQIPDWGMIVNTQGWKETEEYQAREPGGWTNQMMMGHISDFFL